MRIGAKGDRDDAACDMRHAKRTDRELREDCRRFRIRPNRCVDVRSVLFEREGFGEAWIDRNRSRPRVEEKIGIVSGDGDPNDEEPVDSTTV